MASPAGDGATHVAGDEIAIRLAAQPVQAIGDVARRPRRQIEGLQRRAQRIRCDDMRDAVGIFPFG